MDGFDEKYCLSVLERLLGVDSTTGQYEEIQSLICRMLDELGVEYSLVRKGGVIARLGGSGDPLCVTAHVDDLGLMVRHVNADGTLRVTPVGGLRPMYCVTENVRVYTRDGKVFTGSVCRVNGSTHVSDQDEIDAAGDFDKNVCVVLDEDVKSAEDTKKLGVDTGDMIALEPRFRIENGYIKSRFVDDKAAAAVLFTLIRELAKANKLQRKIYFYFAMYEEIGHGTTVLPDDVCDMIAVDIAPTGPAQNSDEHKVSIFAKDSRFPYHWGLTNELRKAAIRADVNCVTDIFTPRYGTDCDGSILAGHDIRHAAIGPGTLNSHGYERTHIDGLRETYKLLEAYIG